MTEFVSDIVVTREGLGHKERGWKYFKTIYKLVSI